MLKDNQPKKYEKILIYLTGYGPFHDIKINPSQLLAEMIYDRKDLISSMFTNISIDLLKIMEVDCSYVDENVKTLYESIEKNQDSSTMKLIIHFGVNVNIEAPKFNLETRGINYIKDGLSRNGKINSSMDINAAINTKIDTKYITHKFGTNFEVSNNAGSFLCNYIYFNTLFEFLSKEHFYTQFIHIPELKFISTDEGLSLFIEYLYGINEMFC